MLHWNSRAVELLNHMLDLDRYPLRQPGVVLAKDEQIGFCGCGAGAVCV